MFCLCFMPKSCPCPRLLPLMKRSEYPLYRCFDPLGQAGISIVWLCLVKKNPSLDPFFRFCPGAPREPLAPTSPDKPAGPSEAKKIFYMTTFYFFTGNFGRMSPKLNFKF